MTDRHMNDAWCEGCTPENCSGCLTGGLVPAGNAADLREAAVRAIAVLLAGRVVEERARDLANQMIDVELALMRGAG